MRSRLHLSDGLDPATNSFNLVRLMAATAVLFSHVAYVRTGTLSADWLSIRDLGWHAVNVFFVVSGLLVMRSAERAPSAASFLMSRALRVYPGLAVGLLLLALVLGPAVSSLPPAAYLAHPDTYAFVVKSLAVPSGNYDLPGVFAASPLQVVDEPLWTLKYEVTCYMMLSLAIAAGLPRSRGLCGLIAASMLPFLVVGFVPDFQQNHTVPAHLARFFFCFALGMAAYRWRRRIPLSAKAALALLAAALALSGTPLAQPAWAVAMGYAALVIGTRRWGAASDLTRHRDWSYGIYIYHWPVLQVLVFAAPAIGYPALIGGALAASFGLAALSWNLIEKPALALKRRVGRGGAAPQAALAG